MEQDTTQIFADLDDEYTDATLIESGKTYKFLQRKYMVVYLHQ